MKPVEGAQVSVENDGYFEACWPQSPRQSRVKQLAARAFSLDGQVVAQLWDYVFRGDEIFQHLEDALRQQYPGIRFVHWKEFGNIHSNDEAELLASLSQRFKDLGVTAAITGMAC